MDIKDISFEPTGEVFVDTGSMVLQYISKQFPEKNLMGLIEWAAKIYVEKWKAKINSVFLNAPITQISKKGENKVTSTLQLYENIINNNDNTGYCRYCGKYSPLVDAGRDKSCLSGSHALVNFHHSHELGFMICPQCTIKYFFLPFGLLQMGNLALLQTATEVGREFWLKKTVKENLDKIGRNSSIEILKYNIKNPANALFNLASEIIIENLNKDINECLTLYHFTNFAASPDIEIYQIPNPVFRFMHLVLKNCNSQWYHFTKINYHITKTQWNPDKEQWEKSGTTLKEGEYINNQNSVYLKLLSGKSILPLMQRFYRSNYVNNKPELNSNMAFYYAKEVLNMEREQIALIKKIGDKIFELMQKENSFKKYLVMLEGANRAYQLRLALIKVIKANYANGYEEPVLTLDDYVNYLFPDGQYWGEVRDLLLIYLYEQLHQKAIKVEEVAEIDLQDTEELNEIA